MIQMISVSRGIDRFIYLVAKSPAGRTFRGIKSLLKLGASRNSFNRSIDRSMLCFPRFYRGTANAKDETSVRNVFNVGNEISIFANADSRSCENYRTTRERWGAFRVA